MGKGDFDMIQIKYDIVGSFLRPEAIKKARAEFKKWCNHKRRFEKG